MNGYSIQDEDSAWRNNGTSGSNVQVYRDNTYRNTTVCVPYGASIGSNGYANDEGSSKRWGGC